MKTLPAKPRAYVVAADRLQAAERKALPTGWQYSPYDRPVANYFLVCAPSPTDLILYPVRLDYVRNELGREQSVVFVGPASGCDDQPLPYHCALALLKWCRRVKKKGGGPVLLWGVVHTPAQYDYLYALTGRLYPNFYSPAPRALMPTLIEMGRRHFPHRFQALHMTVEPVYPRVQPAPRPESAHFFVQRNPHYQRGDTLLVALPLYVGAAVRLLIGAAWAQYRPQKFLRKVMERADAWRGVGQGC